MRIILTLISLLIIVLVAVLASYNPTPIAFQAWNGIIYNISLVYVILSAMIAGLIAGAAWMGSFYFVSMNKLKEYKRKLEKDSVAAECESSKIGVLEAKIEVLEKALQSALNKDSE